MKYLLLILVLFTISFAACKKNKTGNNNKSYVCRIESGDSFWHYTCYTTYVGAHYDTLISITTDSLQNYMQHNMGDSITYDHTLSPCTGMDSLAGGDTFKVSWYTVCQEYKK